jgi:hypothetical protein
MTKAPLGGAKRTDEVVQMLMLTGAAKLGNTCATRARWK